MRRPELTVGLSVSNAGLLVTVPEALVAVQV